MKVEYREYEKTDFLKLALLSDDNCRVNHYNIASSLRQGTNDVEKCILAVEEETIIGYIYGFVLPNGTLLPEFLYVLPEYRRHGIGEKLLRTLEENYGCSSSMIFYNKELHDYYKKLGYISGENLEVAMKYISVVNAEEGEDKIDEIQL